MANPCIALIGMTIVPLSQKPTHYQRNTAGLENADFITSKCACPKSILVKAGGFDEEFAMACCEDSDPEFKLINLGITIIKIDRNKTQPLSPILYYATISCFIVTLAGFALNNILLSKYGFAAWLGLSFVFAFQRLKTTTWRLDHLFDMLVSSFVIPFLSLYWEFYSAINYRKLLL